MADELYPTLHGLERLMKVRLETGRSHSSDILSETEQRVVRELLLDARSEISFLDSHTALLQDTITSLQKIRENSVARIERLRVGIDSHKNKLARVMLTGEKSDVISLDTNITRLQEMVKTIHKNLRAKALRQVERLRMWIAPHNCKNLPPEIISEIFVWCMKMHGFMITLPPSYTHPIWNIVQVCSSWRDVAMTESRLWGRLRIIPTPEYKALNHLFNDICSNRGGQGLIQCDAYISCPADFQNYLSLVSKFPLRIRSQHITFNGFTASTITPCVLPDHLESVSIVMSRSEHVFFATGRGLRKVTIDPDSDIIRRVSLPWNQLTHLNVYAISLARLSNVLRSCVRLVHCEFQLVPRERHNVVTSDNPIGLDYLHTMIVIDESDYSPVLKIMALLVVPKLRNLTFLGDRSRDWWGGLSSRQFQETIVELISRSTCSLEHFEAPPYWMTADAILPLMRAMPHLTDLVAVTRDTVPQSILKTIVAEGLCLKLRDLRGWNVEPTLDSFIAFWRSRWGGPYGGLRNVCLTVRGGDVAFGTEYYASLAPELEKDGRTMWIGSYYRSTTFRDEETTIYISLDSSLF